MEVKFLWIAYPARSRSTPQASGTMWAVTISHRSLLWIQRIYNPFVNGSSKNSLYLTRPANISQSSASYLIFVKRRDTNLKMTATQEIVKQTAFVAMMLGTISSEMCISWSMISAYVGMVAMVSVDLAWFIAKLSRRRYYWCRANIKGISKERKVSNLCHFTHCVRHGHSNFPQAWHFYWRTWEMWCSRLTLLKRPWLTDPRSLEMANSILQQIKDVKGSSASICGE